MIELRYVRYRGPHGLLTDPVLQYRAEGPWIDVAIEEDDNHDVSEFTKDDCDPGGNNIKVTRSGRIIRDRDTGPGFGNDLYINGSGNVDGVEKY